MSFQVYAHGGQAVPLGRVGHVSEVVDTMLYLASPSAGFITGQILTIDGGYSQTLYEPPLWWQRDFTMDMVTS